MKHIKTLTNKTLQNTVKKGGCGECQTSCQSACKTSCTVGNQTCEHSKAIFNRKLTEIIFENGLFIVNTLVEVDLHHIDLIQVSVQG